MRLLALLVSAFTLTAATKIEVLPKSVSLTGSEARQQLIVESTSGAFQEDWTTKAQWTSSDPQVASVDAKGIVAPVSDGEATITASANGQQSTARVKVTAAKAPFTWSFKNHVIPVMTKMGCNQGACHGALAGKNGFKLTLRGYDPDVDYDTLTRSSVGRRMSLSDPASSLVLLKPTFAVPHGGGKRFAVGSLEYRVIAEWIAAGAPPPVAKDPDVVSLEVFPATATLKTGAEQQLVVRAKFSDGHSDDVTRWVKFSSNNEGVASVDDFGHVKMNGSGEAAVTLWYSSRVLYSRLTVPYDNQVAPDVYTNFPRKNYIDDLVLAKLKTLNIAPSKVADDSTFIRRAYWTGPGFCPPRKRLKHSSPTPLRINAPSSLTVCW